MSEPLVVIGNGMAAARFVEELAKQALGRYAIAVVGEEPRLAYNRVLLSSVLADDVASADVELKPAAWWADHGVTVLYGHGATGVDRDIRRVRLSNCATLPYSHLVFATGSQPIRLSVPGMDLPGVMTFRDLADVDRLKKEGARASKAVVIGGGLLGLEAAWGLKKAGADVTVVHLMDRLMERQLDPEGAALLKASVEAKGIDICLSAETARVNGSRRAESVQLLDGRVIPADIVVVAAGIAPNVSLARQAGLDVNRSIVVDDQMRTSVPSHYAIGECAEHRGRCAGLVEPSYEQAIVLAQHLAGHESHYAGSVPATNLKVSGVNLFSAGDFIGAPGTETLTLRDRGLGTYKKLVISKDRLAGALLFGDTADGLWYLDLIRSGQSIAHVRNDLAFGQAFAERMAA